MIKTFKHVLGLFLIAALFSQCSPEPEQRFRFPDQDFIDIPTDNVTPDTGETKGETGTDTAPDPDSIPEPTDDGSSTATEDSSDPTSSDVTDDSSDTSSDSEEEPVDEEPTDTDSSDSTDPTTPVDADNDGQTTEEGDCNDNDASVFTGNYEGAFNNNNTDGKDNNCDGVIDEEGCSCDDVKLIGGTTECKSIKNYLATLPGYNCGRINSNTFDPTTTISGTPVLDGAVVDVEVVEPTSKVESINFDVITIDRVGSDINKSNIENLQIKFNFGEDRSLDCEFKETGFSLKADRLRCDGRGNCTRVEVDTESTADAKTDDSFSFGVDTNDLIKNCTNESAIGSIDLDKLQSISFTAGKKVTKFGIAKMTMTATETDGTTKVFYDNDSVETYLDGGRKADDNYPVQNENCAGKAANGGFSDDDGGIFKPSTDNNISAAAVTKTLHFSRDDKIVSVAMRTQKDVGSGTANKFRIAFQSSDSCGENRWIELDDGPNSRDQRYEYQFYTASFDENVFLSINDEKATKDQLHVDWARVKVKNAWTGRRDNATFERLKDFTLDGRKGKEQEQELQLVE